MMDNQKQTILFVDDEQSILDIANEYFQQRGYHVITARNGLEAVKVIEAHRVDCCFTDINMPEMDGIELAEYLQSNDNTIPVIIMTGYPSLDNTIRTLKNGVVDFLIKPVNLNQMEVCVQRVLRERKLFIENLILKQEIEKKAALEKLNQELRSRVEELDILNKIMSEFAMVSTSSEIFRLVVDISLEVIAATESRFYVINKILQKPFQVVSSILDSRIAYIDKEMDPKIEGLIMDVASDELPLLIPENTGFFGLPDTVNSFIVVPMMIRGKVFGVLTASADKDVVFTERDLYYITFVTHKAAYAIENIALYENIYENLFSTLYAFVKAIEAKDPYTKEHSNRVTDISIAIAKELGCTQEEIDILNVAGRLHDIGKIGVRDNILLKPGKLTPAEYEEIKSHAIVGANIVGQLGLWDREQQIIRHHHERFDGNGYPDGLCKGDIPSLARILTVADVYDAIASDRTYRKKMKPNQTIEIINAGRGTQFDPTVVDKFHRLFEQGKIDDIAP